MVEQLWWNSGTDLVEQWNNDGGTEEQLWWNSETVEQIWWSSGKIMVEQ